MSDSDPGALIHPGERWGVFGGSFDPPHLGHLRLAASLQDADGLDGVLFVPTFRPPHKIQPVASYEDRLEMVRIAVGGIPAFAASDVERDLPVPSYTVHTLEVLRESYPKVSFRLVVGADNLEILEKWVEIDRVLELAPAIIGRRPGSDTVIPDRLKAHITVYQTDVTEVSSTRIREAVMRGESIGRLAPPEVIAYIERHGLYRN